MTKEEAYQKTQEKIRTIQSLCNQLSIVPTAHQMVNKNGIIDNQVFFIDNEDYPIEQLATKPEENEKPSKPATTKKSDGVEKPKKG